ncbi:phosphate/phosphite/phosphonate ABC transporter substrate-binding protein [Desulfosporosinus sp.]|uniref:substrate-binding domain-containing protein n=1 Tax=Desulfosporosinus sp. TaxID=157907 RepID=UPI000E7D5B19|nr:phosphate/phosphite/phosphonate ABC transporter substrate-binding protein [Desulfosporosinus sp.]MBC2722956.1 phosphate/phosphite/phosphonate ABC transporter substrate-binding protein [Desulfosporosinus sp.]MBC2727360.1 phosphate/phosphite/phosphonate ABC transporter substrate-binding protein [Desulfosporosinus sp.]HBV86060.1 phosphate/phosphite/phosphonate ABC transporter substrate-binding protein [Desulfosporosinus sp.]
MLDKQFTRREAIWIGALGLLQLGILTSASVGSWDFEGKSDKPQINFSDVKEPPKNLEQGKNLEVLRVAVASVISPMENVNLYEDLLNLLGERVQKQVQMVQRQNYSDTNNLVESGNVQVAFICSGALLGKDKQEQADRILVTPEIAGSATYRSYIIVPSNSSVHFLSDLKGKTFAYTDPLSFSGHIAPQYMIKKAGYNPAAFFDKTIFTYSHDNSIKAVSEGVVEGAAVDSLIYDLTISRRPELMDKVKIIDQSEEVGNPPVVVSSHTDPKLRALIKNVLLTLHLDEEGKKALKFLEFERFVHPNLSLYDRVWEMSREVGLS